MTRPHKLLAKFRNNPKGVHFRELETVLEQLGFVRIKTNAGSHFKWEHYENFLNYGAPYHNPVKAAYVKRLLQIIDTHFKNLL